MTRRFIVSGPCTLNGTTAVPGDKSIGHRSLLFSALAEGPCTITGLSGGLDNHATATALSLMGVSMELNGSTARVEGVGLRGLSAPSEPIDCANSGTTMRLFAGLLAAQPFATTLVGDRSLTGRPMGRVVHPLRARGARLAGSPSEEKPDEHYPPLHIEALPDGQALQAIEYHTPISSAQVKSAVLLSGLYADGPTALREPTVSRDHTERLLASLGVPVDTAGPMIVLDPEGWRRGWNGFDWHVPGDFSSAAFPLAAAAMCAGSRIEVEGLGLNPTRTGFLDALRAFGASVHVRWGGEAAGGEPVGTMTAEHTSLRATLLGGELVTRSIDEVPVLGAVAACVNGTTRIRDAAELRVKESDRIATTTRMLQAFGVSTRETEDGFDVLGGGVRHPAVVQSEGDHRIAMAGAVLAMATEGESTIENVDCVNTSFPGFCELMRGLGADIREG